MSLCCLICSSHKLWMYFTHWYVICSGIFSLRHVIKNRCVFSHFRFDILVLISAGTVWSLSGRFFEFEFKKVSKSVWCFYVSVTSPAINKKTQYIKGFIPEKISSSKKRHLLFQSDSEYRFFFFFFLHQLVFQWNGSSFNL